jgi:hypothetical protein
MEEEYKKIQNYENYSVSSFGNVRNDMTNKILKNLIDSNGYYQVNLYKNSKMKSMKVHRLVANAFIEKLDGKPFIDHINNNRLDNNISNLRWVTHKENQMNKSMYYNNSSGVKGVTFKKAKNKWHAQIMIDKIAIHLGYFKTIEEATQARVQRARQAFGQFINKCEGINYGAKPMKKRKPKRKITGKKINQIFEEIFKLRDSFKEQESRLQKQLLNVLNI